MTCVLCLLTTLNICQFFSSVAQSCLTLCEPMDCSIPGLPVHHQLPEPTQTHVHHVGDAIQPFHPVIPFSSCLQSFPASGSFPVSWFFASGGQSIEVSASASNPNPNPNKGRSEVKWRGKPKPDSGRSSRTLYFPQRISRLVTAVWETSWCEREKKATIFPSCRHSPSSPHLWSPQTHAAAWGLPPCPGSLCPCDACRGRERILAPQRAGLPGGLLVKNLPAMQEPRETRVWSLGGEDALEEEEMATHSSILAWRLPWTEEPGGIQSMGSQRVGHDGSDLTAAAAAAFLPRKKPGDMRKAEICRLTRDFKGVTPTPTPCCLQLHSNSRRQTLFSTPRSFRSPRPERSRVPHSPLSLP